MLDTQILACLGLAGEYVHVQCLITGVVDAVAETIQSGPRVHGTNGGRKSRNQEADRDQQRGADHQHLRRLRKSDSGPVTAEAINEVTMMITAVTDRAAAAPVESRPM